MAPFALVSMPYKAVKAPQLFGKVPNIEGAFLAFLKISGVFTAQGTNVYAAINTDGHNLADIFFNARNASSVYGGSNTVQPSSMRALSLIRAF